VKLLIVGGNGQVGFELRRSLAVLGDVVAADRSRCDVADRDQVRALMWAEQPDVVVNAAAYTAVDRAEEFPSLAMRVNCDGPAALAEEADDLGALLVHYSTDHVFDGSRDRPYREDDPVQPCNAYGQSKAAGEAAIRAATGRHLILRTSWVYGAHGDNFLKTMLRAMRERDALRVVGDQIGAPTGAALIADATAQVLARYIASNGVDFPCGTYHLAAAGETTWHDYACLVGELARAAGFPLRVGPESIRRVTTAEYPRPARRPASSCLDTSRLRETFGLALPHWEAGVRQVMQVLADCAEAA
jgi:dTDP-4-dehydrorhamnose reductase